MSINRITYFHDFVNHDICIFNNYNFTILYFYDNFDFKIFLSELKEDQMYVVSFEFMYSLSTYDEEGPTINLSKPIILTKNSNPQLISKFINERIDNCIKSFYLDDSLFFNKNKDDGPGIIVKFNQINLF